MANHQSTMLVKLYTSSVLLVLFVHFAEVVPRHSILVKTIGFGLEWEPVLSSLLVEVLDDISFPNTVNIETFLYPLWWVSLYFFSLRAIRVIIGLYKLQDFHSSIHIHSATGSKFRTINTTNTKPVLITEYTTARRESCFCVVESEERSLFSVHFGEWSFNHQLVRGRDVGEVNLIICWHQTGWSVNRESNIVRSF